jgi:hypothetical protein
MPEVVTKHPDVVKQVLASAGARCGAGEPQRILTKCPREQFCALPGGEICVYGVDGVDSMTQLTRAELCQARGEAPPPAGGTPLVGADVGATAGLSVAVAAALALGRRRARRAR